MAFGTKANNKPDDPNHVSESPEARKGRRALTQMLQKAGDEVIATMTTEGATPETISITKNDVLSKMVWGMLLDRKVIFPDGTVMTVTNLTDWFEAVKFLFRQVDGPPPVEVGLSLGTGFNPVAWAEQRRERLADATLGLPDESVLVSATPQNTIEAEVTPVPDEGEMSIVEVDRESVVA
jgi:hypothetical protein